MLLKVSCFECYFNTCSDTSILNNYTLVKWNFANITLSICCTHVLVISGDLYLFAYIITQAS
jgi:hypothetical protein